MDIEIIKTKPSNIDKLIKSIVLDHTRFSDKLLTSKLNELRSLAFSECEDKSDTFYRKLIKDIEEIETHEEAKPQWDREKVYPKNGFTIAN